MVKFLRIVTAPENNVHKLIFEDDSAIVESVAYTYPGRRVVCFSVQSGCPIGCVFCGTGKRYLRNMTAREITYQIMKSMYYVLRWAARKSHAKAVELLLDAGADVHARNDYALQWAAKNGHVDVVALLEARDED